MEGPEQLDLTSDGLSEEKLITFARRTLSPPAAVVATEAERLERMREEQRGRIAAQLIMLLLLAVFATVLLPVLLAIIFRALFVESPIQETTSVMQAVGTTVITPLVGLIGAVIGFYFGTPRGGAQPPPTLPTERDGR
jgi:hypothetical protein